MLRAKVLAGVPAGTDDGGASERRFPCWGRHLGATPCLHGALGENPVQILDERRRRLGVVTSLEALSLDPFSLVPFLVHCLGGNRRGWHLRCVAR